MPDQVDPKEMARRVMAAKAVQAEIQDPRQTLGAWGEAVGKRIAQALPPLSEGTKERWRGRVHNVASFMGGEGRDKPQVGVVQEYYGVTHPHLQQDAELEANRQLIEDRRRQLEDQAKAVDGGEIDLPARDITSYERSDANGQPVTTYTQEDIDRVKRAIAAAQK